MTANEMAEELDLRIDRVDSLGSPGYEDFDLTSVLTEAQWLYIKKFVSGINNRKGESFDETEIRTQGLSALIKQGANLTVSSDQTGVIQNGVFYDLPADFMYAIYEQVTTDKLDCTDTNNSTYIVGWVNVVSHDEIWQFKYNKYEKPYCKNYGWARVWRLSYQREVSGNNPSAAATPKRHQIVTDGTFNVTDYTLNYLINPPQITVDRNNPSNSRNCILDESTHTVIVDIAKDLTLQRVKEQKIQNIEPVKDLE